MRLCGYDGKSEFLCALYVVNAMCVSGERKHLHIAAERHASLQQLPQFTTSGCAIHVQGRQIKAVPTDARSKERTSPATATATAKAAANTTANSRVLDA